MPRIGVSPVGGDVGGDQRGGEVLVHHCLDTDELAAALDDRHAAPAAADDERPQIQQCEHRRPFDDPARPG
jgi:hypothetical protein